MELPEARIVETNHLMVVDSTTPPAWFEGFHGRVLTAQELPSRLAEVMGKVVYVGAEVSRLSGLDLQAAKRVLLLRDRSMLGQEPASVWPLVEPGCIPMRIPGLGVYYRRFFPSEVDLYQQVCSEHTFQALTESTKPATAHRTGIYLTPVEKRGDALHFHLLRCSTNLLGPTENFRAADHRIVDALNDEAALLFEGQAPLNHVLAQLYRNTRSATTQKQAKAKISAHADKTKDMPRNGIMAFCTFYDRLDKLRPLARDPFDWGHNEVSGLTRLRFRLKEQASAQGSRELPAEYTLTLYPNSVFFMPLSTNRLYTHEIQSSMLDAERLPTRLGYVVRCSNTQAVHQDGQTYLKQGDGLVKLQPPTPEGMLELRKLYAEENRSQGFIDYGARFLFSMNQGDYTPPTL